MIVRAAHDKDNPFVQIRRATAQDANLPARALGVLVYLMSKPDTWEPTVDDICRRFSDVGREQAYKIINEIFMPLRYARRQPERNGGKFTRWLMEIHEIPFPENQEMETPDTDNQEVVAPLPDLPDLEKPDAENQKVVKTHKTQRDKGGSKVRQKRPPFTGLPDLEKPDTENQHLYKKRKYLIQNKENTEGKTESGAHAPASFPDNQEVDTPAKSLSRQECYSIFCEIRQTVGEYEAPYQNKKADFVRLAELIKKYDAANWPITRKRFEQAARNYFATPRSAHTLADLAANFSEFYKNPHNEFGRPSKTGNGQVPGVSPAVRETIAAGERILAELRSKGELE